MRDLNHLYSEFMVGNIVRERQARVKNRHAEAAAHRPSIIERMIAMIGGMRHDTPDITPEAAGMTDLTESAVS